MSDTKGQFIYVHVPFCEQKCTYCDFFTITDPDRAHPLSAVWLDLCAREAELWANIGDLEKSNPIRTVFFGGGTPSLLSPAAISQFLKALKNRFGFTTDAEITLETQPDTVDRAKCDAFANAGINRFSIGVQTFDQAILARTGRRHNVEQSADALRAAAASGQVVSLDLICAWPGQTLAQAQEDLVTALTFSPAHISVYELTFHEGTSLHRDRKAGRTAEADEELRVAMFEQTRTTLIDAGLEHYEISNYARPGARSIHNQNYWRLGNYVGLGAGAHSLVFPHRYLNPNSAGDYARSIREGRLFRKTCSATDPDIVVAENLTMALRNLDGLDLQWFARKMGRDLLTDKARLIGQLVDEGLVHVDGTTLHLTHEGELRSDTIVEHLM